LSNIREGEEGCWEVREGVRRLTGKCGAARKRVREGGGGQLDKEEDGDIHFFRVWKKRSEA